MKKIDLALLITVILLSLFGLLMIYDASSYVAFRDFGDKFYYLREQSLWFVLGLVSLGFFSTFDYRRLYNLALPILLMAIVFLVLVFVPGLGVTALGARRWVNFRFFTLQPAEVAKLALAIYLSAWFSVKEKGRLLAFGLLLTLVLGLVIVEPDMGTAAIILAEALVLYFISGGNVAHFMLLIPLVTGLGFLLVRLEPYRAKRLTSFISLNQSIEGTSYHVKQILIALGMGGVMGVGIGNSLQKYAYLPESTTDSIFAIIAEEFGFIGSVVLIFMFLIVIWRGFSIAATAKDTFGRLLASGIITFLATQTIINLAAQTALLPLTGIPLPFISYGGSSLVVDFCAVGILLNIAKQRT